jgi:hypothetical protein
MEAVRFSETSISFYEIIWCHILVNSNFFLKEVKCFNSIHLCFDDLHVEEKMSQIVCRYERSSTKNLNLEWSYFVSLRAFKRSRDSVVGIATGYGLDDRGVGIRVPVGARIFLHVVQTGSGVYPTSYPMGTGGSFPGVKAARDWSWPLTSSYCRDQENVDLYIHSPIRLHGVVLN